MALPFLRSNVEVICHRLICTFYREKGDLFYQKQDFVIGSDDDRILDTIPPPSSSGVAAAASTDANGNVSSDMQVLNDVINRIGSSGLTTLQMVEAETLHDILVKQMLTDHVRTKLVQQASNKSAAKAAGSNMASDFSLKGSVGSHSNTEGGHTSRRLSVSVSAVIPAVPIGAGAGNERLTMAQRLGLEANFLTSEEKDWLQLDRILNAEYYSASAGAEVKAAYANMDEEDEDDDLDEQMVGDKLSDENGRYYQDSSSSSSSSAGPDEWTCPYKTSDELLSIYHKKIDTKDYISALQLHRDKIHNSAVSLNSGTNPRAAAERDRATAGGNDTQFTSDEIRVKYLMDKYYVSDKESMLGIERLKAMHFLTNKIKTVFYQVEREEHLAYHLTMENLLTNTRDSENQLIHTEAERLFQVKVKTKQSLRELTEAHVKAMRLLKDSNQTKGDNIREKQLVVAESNEAPNKNKINRSSFYYGDFIKKDADDDDSLSSLERQRMWGAFTHVHPARFVTYFRLFPFTQSHDSLIPMYIVRGLSLKLHVSLCRSITPRCIIRHPSLIPQTACSRFTPTTIPH